MEKNLKIIHIIACIASLFLIIYSYKLSIGKPTCLYSDYVSLQSISMLLTIVTIPVILKVYKNKTTELEKKTNPDKVFYKWNIIRLSVIFFLICLNVIVYSITHLNSYLLCEIITFIILVFFCIPKKEIPAEEKTVQNQEQK